MNTRLQQFLGAENISQSQFADEIGVARASVSHILAGRNKPGYEFLTNLMSRYPRLNMEWLLAGKGKMYKDSSLPQPQPDLFSTPQEEEIPVEEPAPEPNIETSQATTPLPPAPQPSENQRNITKIIVFYDDNTFQELR